MPCDVGDPRNMHVKGVQVKWRLRVATVSTFSLLSWCEVQHPVIIGPGTWDMVDISRTSS